MSLVDATSQSAEATQRNPGWTRDELILALDLYMRFKGNPPGKGGDEIIALSAILNRMAGSASVGMTDFRNPNGVYMKLMNFRRFDPVYQAQGKSGLARGNKLEEVVWRDFASEPQRLAKTAEAIKENLEVSADEDAPFDGIEEAEEGRTLTRAHLIRERSRKLVAAKKAASLKATGALRCEACGFEFGVAYGERGRGFIEVHHALPVHQLTWPRRAPVGQERRARPRPGPTTPTGSRAARSGRSGTPPNWVQPSGCAGG